MLIKFFKVRFIIIEHMTTKFNLSFSRLKSWSNKEFKSFKLKFCKVKLFVIKDSNSFLLLKSLVIISWVIERSFVENFKLFIFEFFSDFFNGSFGVCIMDIDKVGLIVVRNSRVERLFMETSLTSFTEEYSVFKLF